MSLLYRIYQYENLNDIKLFGRKHVHPAEQQKVYFFSYCHNSQMISNAYNMSKI